jgi:hypothetical protein
MKLMANRIRIESRGDVVTDDRIFYLPVPTEWECECIVDRAIWKQDWERVRRPMSLLKCDVCGAAKREAAYVNPPEVDISNCLEGYELHGHIGEIRRVTLHAILIGGHVTAEVDEIVARHIKPKRRRWRQRIVDVTRFGSTAKEVVKA